jgi:hypothetical protein
MLLFLRLITNAISNQPTIRSRMTASTSGLTEGDFLLISNALNEGEFRSP